MPSVTLALPPEVTANQGLTSQMKQTIGDRVDDALRIHFRLVDVRETVTQPDDAFAVIVTIVFSGVETTEYHDLRVGELREDVRIAMDNFRSLAGFGRYKIVIVFDYESN